MHGYLFYKIIYNFLTTDLLSEQTNEVQNFYGAFMQEILDLHPVSKNGGKADFITDLDSSETLESADSVYQMVKKRYLPLATKMMRTLQKVIIDCLEYFRQEVLKSGILDLNYDKIVSQNDKPQEEESYYDWSSCY